MKITRFPVIALALVATATTFVGMGQASAQINIQVGGPPPAPGMNIPGAIPIVMRFGFPARMSGAMAAGFGSAVTGHILPTAARSGFPDTTVMGTGIPATGAAN